MPLRGYLRKDDVWGHILFNTNYRICLFTVRYQILVKSILVLNIVTSLCLTQEFGRLSTQSLTHGNFQWSYKGFDFNTFIHPHVYSKAQLKDTTLRSYQCWQLPSGSRIHAFGFILIQCRPQSKQLKMKYYTNCLSSISAKRIKLTKQDDCHLVLQHYRKRFKRIAVVLG